MHSAQPPRFTEEVPGVGGQGLWRSFWSRLMAELVSKIIFHIFLGRGNSTEGERRVLHTEEHVPRPKLREL